MLKNNFKGITLLEAFLAAFLFIISVAAIFVTMTVLRKPAVNNEKAVQAALVLSDFLDDLRSKVDYRDYDTGSLKVGTDVGPIQIEANSGNYTVFYNVVDVNGSREVNATINWVDSF